LRFDGKDKNAFRVSNPCSTELSWMFSFANAPINDSKVFYSIIFAATAGLRMKSLMRASNSLNVSLVGV